MRHTPGPWSVPHFARADAACNCAYVYSDQQRGMGAICEVYFDKGDDDDHEEIEVAKANARLIAAAPDMLAALETAESDIRGWCDDEGRNPETHDALQIVRAAIAKATGE